MMITIETGCLGKVCNTVSNNDNNNNNNGTNLELSVSAALSSSMTWSVPITMKMMDNSSLGKVYDKVNYVNHYNDGTLIQVLQLSGQAL